MKEITLEKLLETFVSNFEEAPQFHRKNCMINVEDHSYDGKYHSQCSCGLTQIAVQEAETLLQKQRDEFVKPEAFSVGVIVAPDVEARDMGGEAGNLFAIFEDNRVNRKYVVDLLSKSNISIQER